MIRCDVWSADVEWLHAEHLALLDGVELTRRAAYVREEDADRFALGAVLLRLVAGPAARIDRTCARCGEPHGRPVVAGGPHVSVAHSGARVLVAVCREAAVGVDVERGDEQVWARKEAVLKATGDGLNVEPDGVVIDAGRVVTYDGRALEARVVDVEVGAGYAAAVAVLGGGTVEVVLHDARALLPGCHIDVRGG